jgi:regulator of sigma E protease
MVIVTIIAFIVILSVLVFFHELGHFWTARKFGVKVREFGLGLPPRAVGARRKGKKWEIVKGAKAKAMETKDTIYSLNWLPIGGFVNIGEDDGDSSDPESFQSKSASKRSLILVAGVIMNTILTAVLLAIVFMIGTPQVVDPSTQDLSKYKDLGVTVNHVIEDSPAA